MELKFYDPTTYLVGCPVAIHPKYEGRQQLLIRDIRARYDEAVSELLEELPEVLR